MSRPKLLDLFCGAGGCSVGYHRAGFDVTGVDARPQPSYPFAFVQADALAYLGEHGREYDAVHASPPCQRYSITRRIHGNGETHPDLLEPTRAALVSNGRPWIIENVPGAPVRFPVLLCGLMFGLRVFRHRLFESSVLLFCPPHPEHPTGNCTGAGVGYSTGKEGYVCVAGNNFNRQAGAAAMGIDWMRTRQELAQAIPPAYTEYLGRQLMRAMRRVGNG